MVLPFIIPSVAAAVSGLIGKSAGAAEGAEKLELVKELVSLTPDQANAVDAIKAQPLSELRDRRELGVGPLSPLPENASARARSIRQARIDASTGVSVTAEEKAAIARAPDQAAAVRALVDKKVAEARARR